MTCEARRCNDQMHCGRCGLQWDIDEEKPECKPVVIAVDPAQPGSDRTVECQVRNGQIVIDSLKEMFK